jgi:hypothetical protein
MLILILVLSKALPCLTHIILVEPILMLSLFHVAQPYDYCKCYSLFLIYALLHMFCVLNDIEGVMIPCLCTLYSNAKNILICARTLGSFPILFRTLLRPYHNIFFCLFGSWILNIVWFPPKIHHWICALDFTHILRIAHLTEELSLYWPSKFFRPFRQLVPMGEKFRGFWRSGREVVLSFMHIYLWYM